MRSQQRTLWTAERERERERERGEVVAIGITIPNSIIANTKIINESAPMPKLKIAEENEYVAKDPIREDSSTQ